MDKRTVRDWINYRDDCEYKFGLRLGTDVQGYINALQGSGTYDDPYYAMPIDSLVQKKMYNRDIIDYLPLKGKVFFNPVGGYYYVYYLTKYDDFDIQNRTCCIATNRGDAYFKDTYTYFTSSWDWRYKIDTSDTKAIRQWAREQQAERKQRVAAMERHATEMRHKANAEYKRSWLADNLDNIWDCFQIFGIGIILLGWVGVLLWTIYAGIVVSPSLFLLTLGYGGLTWLGVSKFIEEENQYKRGRQEPKQPNIKR